MRAWMPRAAAALVAIICWAALEIRLEETFADNGNLLGSAWILLRFYEVRSHNHALSREAGEQAVEKRRLENRLAVLERIVTDKGAQTAEQIEALRDGTRIESGEQVR